MDSSLNFDCPFNDQFIATMSSEVIDNVIAVIGEKEETEEKSQKENKTLNGRKTIFDFIKEKEKEILDLIKEKEKGALILDALEEIMTKLKTN